MSCLHIEKVTRFFKKHSINVPIEEPDLGATLPGVMDANIHNIHNYQIIRLTRFPADNKLAIIN